MQTLQNILGALLKYILDGKIPKDNPKFNGKGNWLPEIYQIGVRNPQGMDVSPYDNKIYLTNHGTKGAIGLVKQGMVKTLKLENIGMRLEQIVRTKNSDLNGNQDLQKLSNIGISSIAISSMIIYKRNSLKNGTVML